MGYRRLLRLLLLVASGSLGACSQSSNAPYYIGGSNSSDSSAVKTRLASTLSDLAILGEKRAGSPSDDAASAAIAAKFSDAGLSDVAFEGFTFPGFSSSNSALTVTLDGAPVATLHDVLAYSGGGAIDADLVYAGAGSAADFAGKDVSKKIAVIDRDPKVRLVTQYAAAVAEGSAGVVFVSRRTMNLIEMGAVFEAEDGAGPIPAIAIGNDDGDSIERAIAAGQTAHAAISVTETVAPAHGRNVVGVLPGLDPTGPYILVGAHYDTWFEGAAGDGAGVAAAIEIARTLAQGETRRFGIAFVAFDAGEIGFLGGYSYLRRHVVAAKERLRAFIDLEKPSAAEPGTCVVAHTNGSPIDAALSASGAAALYMNDEGMQALPPAFGGVLPGDAQGLYRSGIQGAMTECAGPYDDTIADTADKIDMDFLAHSVLVFESALDALDADQPASFVAHDLEVWSIDASTAPAGSDRELSVVVKDGSGVPQEAAAVRAWLDVDDFTRAFEGETVTDRAGRASFSISAAALAKGSGGRWIHVTAGEDTPLAEAVLAAP